MKSLISIIGAIWITLSPMGINHARGAEGGSGGGNSHFEPTHGQDARNPETHEDLSQLSIAELAARQEQAEQEAAKYRTEIQSRLLD